MRAYFSAALLIACSFDADVVGDSATLGGGTETTSSTGGGSFDASTATTSGATTTGATTKPTTTTGESTSTESSAGGTDESTTVDPSLGTSSSSGGPDVCLDLLWVTGNPDIASSEDAPFFEAVAELGYDIEAVLNTSSAVGDADGKCAVMLSSEGQSTDVNTKFRDVTIPVIVWEHGLFDDMGMVATSGDEGTVGAESIDIVMADHPLAAGLSDTVAIQMAIDQLTFGHANMNVVATIVGSPTQAAIFFYETGDEMPSLLPAPALRIGLPFAGESVTPPTEDGIALFVAAVRWATTEK